MPYIEKPAREQISTFLDPLKRALRLRGHSTGELNYTITKLVDQYLGDHPNYDRLNSAIGVLECAKLELYRRRAESYEDVKRIKNGDVYSG